MTCRFSLVLALAFGALGSAGQPAPLPLRFDGKYQGLRPRQRELVFQWSAEFEKILGRPADAAAIYDELPLTARTTFEAVTHALSRSQLTDASGKSLGTALDLIEVVERVAGQVAGARGDRQFRIYVYLRGGAFDTLNKSREFRRERDNTVFHVGYPINFRQQGGVPSIQISVTRTGRRADIDVDYRPSGGIAALTSGHLTAANSNVRAGNNHSRHNRRWNGLGNWWRDLVAGLLAPPPAAEVADIVPTGNPQLDTLSKGALPSLLQGHLEEWLVRQQSANLLSTLSVKAYPCVAEFGDGSRPDSKLALVRTLNRLQEVNRRLGTVARLEDAMVPVSYPLPGAEPVDHPGSQLFSLQRVHEDTAWAMDCRVRYGLHLVEAIPRPGHKLSQTYIAAFRFREANSPGFVVQTWQKEGGLWRLVSFGIKTDGEAPPTDLVSATSKPPSVPSADAALALAADTLLTKWLIDRNYADAAKLFLPSAAICAGYAASGGQRNPSGSTSIRGFLEETAALAAKEKDLASLLSAAQLAHPELRLLDHPRTETYLLAEVPPEVVSVHSCAKSRAAAAGNAKPEGGFLMAFHFRHGAEDESGGVVSLFWRRTAGEWRIAWYGVSSD